MLMIRSARKSDAAEVLRLAHAAGVGLTTLPADAGLIAGRIRHMERALEDPVDTPRGEKYLFVLEDLLTGKLGGVCGILARVGGFEPFYSYVIESRTHRSKSLDVSKVVHALHLAESHQGPSEIGTLFVHPDARGGGVGRQLSLSRFLFMACHPERFADSVIAEMRGVQDTVGNSPFWDAVGHHFFDMDFASADGHSAAGKTFIAELMPRHPIYIPLLPKAAQAVIGEVHAQTRPALRLLKQEGFEFAKEVDIFDGGPMYRAQTSAVRAIRETQTAPLIAVHGCETPGAELVSNGGLADFRVCLSTTRAVEGGVSLPRDVALALSLKIGDPVSWVAARANQPPMSTDKTGA